jgi:hypothetical protein
MMRRVLLCLIALSVCAVATTSSAAARVNVRVGLGDQNPQVFADPNYKALHLRQVRLFVPWNVMDDTSARRKMRAWVVAARRTGARPLIHVSTDNYAIRKAHLPSRSAYRSKIGRLVRYLRPLGVQDFGAWNEANHASQPTWNHPSAAAKYFVEMRRAVFSHCRAGVCRVVGLDVLDQAGVDRYISRFIHALGRSYASRYLRIVGIHNYSDVNRHRTTGLREIMRSVHRYTHRPKFWLTETGGVVKFGRSFPCSESRAASRLDYLFDVIHAYRHSLERVYLYNWYGASCAGRMDVGIVGPSGGVRRSYSVVKRRLGGVLR